jgi:hypothetical protein
MHAEALAENKRFDANMRKLREDQEKEYELHLERQRNLVISHLEYIEDRNLAFAEHERRLTSERDAEFENSLHRRDDAIRHTNQRLNEWVRNLDRASDGIGKLFGKGSRNNFLNFVGRFVGGIARMVTIVPRLTRYFLALGQSMKYAFDETMRSSGSVFRAFVASFIAGAETLGATIATAGLALVGFVAFLGVLLIALGPIIGLLSGLVGILVALASTIYFAVIGSVAALAGAMLPLVAIVGGLVGAFLAMDDAQKKALSNSFKPTIDEFKELGEILADEAFAKAPEQAKRLGDELRGLEPLAEGVGKAISAIGDGWLDMLEGDGFTRFKREMTEFLPGAVEQLGTIIGNVAGGIGGLFVGMIPITERFLGWLEDITAEFNNWANSPGGQRDIRKFLREAGDSAEALGGFLASAGDFLQTLLDKGQGTGDTLFGKMTDQLEEWTAWLDDPANQAAIQQWFTDAEKLATEIGNATLAIIEFVDELDRQSTRAQGLWIVKGFTLVFEALAGQILFMQRAFERLGWAISETAGIIKNFFSGKGFGGKGGMLKLIDVNFVSGQVAKVVGFFTKLPGRIATAVAPSVARFRNQLAGLPGIAGSIVGRIVDRFSALPGRVAGVVSEVKGKVEAKFEAIVDGIRDVPGKIVGLFEDLGTRILAAIGKIVIRPIVDWPSLNPNGAVKGNPVSGADLPQNDPGVNRFSMGSPSGMTTQIMGGASRQVVANNWQIITPTDDPVAVANEVLNRLVAQLV